MILFEKIPKFQDAWDKTGYRVLMAGMGDDTAMLICEMFERGYEPDEIIFCDTGSEFRHTYEFINKVELFCKNHNWSKVKVLKQVNHDWSQKKLIEIVEKNKTLPAAAFGYKTCSQRFKIQVADKYLNNKKECKEVWGSRILDEQKGSVLKVVGINAHEQSRANAWRPQHKFVQIFPLIEWNIGERESLAVERCGLYYPGKSSCIMCPHLTGSELVMMRDNYPEDFERIKKIEKNYIDFNMLDDSTTVGLCRSKTIDQMIDRYEKNRIDTPIGECGVCKNQ